MFHCPKLVSAKILHWYLQNPSNSPFVLVFLSFSIKYLMFFWISIMFALLIFPFLSLEISGVWILDGSSILFRLFDSLFCDWIYLLFFCYLFVYELVKKKLWFGVLGLSFIKNEFFICFSLWFFCFIFIFIFLTFLCTEVFSVPEKVGFGFFPPHLVKFLNFKMASFFRKWNYEIDIFSAWVNVL